MGRIDQDLWTPFIKQWEEAASAGLTAGELSELTGVNVNTLVGRQFTLRQRGIMLPLLRGQRGQRGSKAKPRRSEQRVVPKHSVESMVIYVM